MTFPFILFRAVLNVLMFSSKSFQLSTGYISEALSSGGNVHCTSCLKYNLCYFQESPEKSQGRSFQTGYNVM